jgi:hypothetical protein
VRWAWIALFAAGCEGGVILGFSATGSPDGGGHPDGAGGDALPMGDGGGDLLSGLMRVTANCMVASTAKYATDSGAPPTIDICRLNGAFFWKSDMDIDCDGKTTTVCNSNTDPAYQAQTSFNQSNGQPLDASMLPYVVVPLPSARFDYAASGIHGGAVAAVIYNGRVTFAVFGDEGPSDIIGEASYATAQSLGIDPNPATGGVDSGVTFIVFTGTGAVVNPIEDHNGAVTLGQQLAMQLVANN